MKGCPTHSQIGYGNATVGYAGITTTKGANYKYLLSGSSRYIASAKLGVKTSNNSVNNNVKEKRRPYGGFYRLNKSKVSKKALAFAALKSSQKFMAFYSISFPAGMPERYAWRIHNTVLTRLRKRNKNFNYLWVAERQGNGTAHFHMLTDTYFNVRIVNYYYAVAIKNLLSSYPDLPIHFNALKYNGVDVKRVYSVKGAARYMTKYMTKQEETWEKLPWNCSNVISQLFTGAHVSQDYIDLCVDVLAWCKGYEGVMPLNRSFYNIVHVFFKSHLRTSHIKLIEQVNECIYMKNFSYANTLLQDFHVLSEGWFFDSYGAIRAPKMPNEKVVCALPIGWSQHSLSLPYDVWLN